MRINEFKIEVFRFKNYTISYHWCLFEKCNKTKVYNHQFHSDPENHRS
jgi:hypothetical protein